MKQNREPRNRPTYIQSTDQLKKEQNVYNKAKIVFLTNSAGTSGYPHAKKINK